MQQPGQPVYPDALRHVRRTDLSGDMVLFLCFSFSSNVSCPGEVSSFLQIIILVLITIGFPFKGNIHVCHTEVSVDKQPYPPLYYINNVEPKKQQFLLLSRMYPLMLQAHLVQMLLGEDHAEEIYGNVRLTKRDNSVIDYKHFAMRLYYCRVV